MYCQLGRELIPGHPQYSETRAMPASKSIDRRRVFKLGLDWFGLVLDLEEGAFIC